jgi:hypothetical protein
MLTLAIISICLVHHTVASRPENPRRGRCHLGNNSGQNRKLGFGPNIHALNVLLSDPCGVAYWSTRRPPKQKNSGSNSRQCVVNYIGLK